MDTQLANMEQGLKRMSRTGCPGEHDWPNSVRFVQGFGIALLEAAACYTTANRHLLEPSSTRRMVGKSQRSAT